MSDWQQKITTLPPGHPSLPPRPISTGVGVSSRVLQYDQAYSNSYAYSLYHVPYTYHLAMSNYPPPRPGYGSNQASHGGQSSSYSSSAPVIQNPFPLPGQEPAGANRPGYDPEYEAQLAQWQSAYINKEDPGAVKVTTRPTSAAVTEGTATDKGSNAANTREGKPLTVVRHGGGKTWEDESLIEWGDDPRLFIGNLAGEVTDDSLLKAFAKYNPAKARVIRDKRTTKSKGFGFVSFKNPDDYFAAAKEMVGKYIGSHPVTVQRAGKIATASTVRENKNNNRNRKPGFREGHANTGAGVRKPQKTKGPKLLG